MPWQQDNLWKMRTFFPPRVTASSNHSPSQGRFALTVAMFAQEDISSEDLEAVRVRPLPGPGCGRKVWCPSPPSKVLGLGIPRRGSGRKVGCQPRKAPASGSHVKPEMGPRSLTPSHLPGRRCEVPADRVWSLRPDLKVFVPAATEASPSPHL